MQLPCSELTVQMFAYAAKDHCRTHGTTPEHFAKIASKNRTQGAQNPRAATQVCMHFLYLFTSQFEFSLNLVFSINVLPWQS